LASLIRKNEVVDEPAAVISDETMKEILYPEISSIERAEKAESELQLLRTDYVGRIAGMVKAIAAVERSRSQAAEAVHYLESLNEMCAVELIEEYRRTSARFRSAFPTTFGLAPYSMGRANRLKNPEVYK